MTSTKNTIINIFIYILIMVLAGSTVYFYLKSQDKNSVKIPTKLSPTVTTTPIPTADPKLPTPNSQTPTNITQPAKSTNRPSNPAQTYTVQAGETLFGIATKLNMNWTRIAETNNLPSGDSIKEGQVLYIPSYDEASKKLYLEFTPDTAKAAQIQQQAANLPTSPYLDPTATAKQDSLGFYGLDTTATYAFVSKNELDGTAIVDVTKSDKKFIISLTQPVNKGKDGIWAISKITPN